MKASVTVEGKDLIDAARKSKSENLKRAANEVGGVRQLTIMKYHGGPDVELRGGVNLNPVVSLKPPSIKIEVTPFAGITVTW